MVVARSKLPNNGRHIPRGGYAVRGMQIAYDRVADNMQIAYSKTASFFFFCFAKPEKWPDDEWWRRATTCPENPGRVRHADCRLQTVAYVCRLHMQIAYESVADNVVTN